ncbi:META and DUF4377 domain-containing protein [Aquitalea denitrificans]|uniref:META and DUF4377 domain-containing protein n=1 Tax=Aquitalea denitrificans TaxID=519081 RepID=UPI00135AD27B|nr:META and DUF4377 domain-containing protein [Aquitalea denitrificans]
MFRHTTLLLAVLLSALAWAQADLPAGDWQLASPNVATPLPTLSVRDGRVSGFAGCNRFSGQHNAAGKLVLASARMMCAPAMMQTEQAYLDFLSQPFTNKVDSKTGELVLNGSRGEYRFTRQPAPVVSKPVAAVEQPQYLYVSSVRKNCSAGAGQMQCLQVRSSENQPWQLFYGEIVGFKPQPDTAYYLKLRYEAVKNPPADASRVRTVLERVVFSETITRSRL